jgi:hypothetical protein
MAKRAGGRQLTAQDVRLASGPDPRLRGYLAASV